MNFLTTAQVAEKLHMHPKVIERKARDLSDPIPALKIGREWRYIESEVDAWALKHRYEPADTMSEIVDDIIEGIRRTHK